MFLCSQKLVGNGHVRRQAVQTVYFSLSCRSSALSGCEFLRAEYKGGGGGGGGGDILRKTGTTGIWREGQVGAMGTISWTTTSCG